MAQSSGTHARRKLDHLHVNPRRRRRQQRSGDGSSDAPRRYQRLRLSAQPQNHADDLSPLQVNRVADAPVWDHATQLLLALGGRGATPDGDVKAVVRQQPAEEQTGAGTPQSCACAGTSTRPPARVCRR